jgi:hypothetical protein
MARGVDFPTFFQLWADLRGWSVPDVHWRAVHWLQNYGGESGIGVLRCFRGFGKSTILAVYNAWRFYDNAEYRILHQSEADGTAYKTSRDTQNVLRRHPLTQGLFRDGGVEQWWVNGNDDPRNGSMYARGILSNVTSARCDEAQNDDCEVPRNIRTTEAREQLEYRLGEQNFILVPGGRQLFVGTPHCHDSLYDKMEALGADCLTIPLFEREHRIESAGAKVYALPFAPEYVFAGIGKGATLLVEGVDYTVRGTRIEFAKAPMALVDCYSGCAWPDRFTRDDLQKRRRRTKTVNYWDSQYMLHSRPVHEMRLDPARLLLYAVEPTYTTANKALQCWLGKARIVGATMHWDPASGKLRSDTSALALLLQDDAGRWYWHRCIELTGDVVKFAQDARSIIGGQVWQICDVVEQFRIRRVTVETNGPGEFAPKFLQAALKQRNLPCAVKGEHESRSKNGKILDAFEAPMKSGMLYAHASVADGPAFAQMREWNPAVINQPDDYLDATAVAMGHEPQRMAEALRNRNADARDDWRPGAGVFEAELEL